MNANGWNKMEWMNEWGMSQWINFIQTHKW